TGYRYSTGWAKDQRVYFAIDFSQPFATPPVLADSTSVLQPDIGQSHQGTFLRGQFDFNSSELTVKVGLSTANVAGALAALDAQVESDFATVRQKAEAAWLKELNKIQVKSEDEALKRTFYTALYRTCLAPVVLEDALGQYKGVDGEIHTAEAYTRYGLFSLWDTFRATNPLHTITQAERVNDIIRSMLAHYKEYGLLPVWDLLANETNTMTGYHAVPVLVDAYLKGFRDYDVELAFEAVRKSAQQNIRATDHYRKYQYIPYDKAGQSVTRTLEYAYDDWCIAQMAKAMGKDEAYETFSARAAYYKNMFDESTGFMRAKMADGSWKSPFDPQYSNHDFSTSEYTEGNAWQHSWFVPHDVQTLIDLHGGPTQFVQKLDSLFSISSEIRGENKSVDISGLIGQYAHGNEPSHHIAYLYNYANRPDKAQAQLKNIMKTQYNDTPHGLCGNEDCGQMSAWYVFSSIGLYPMNPASGIYDLGICLFDEVQIHLPNGKVFQIDNQNPTAERLTGLRLNGESISDRRLSHAQLMQGGNLSFDAQ
ncbi:MAG: GH92 family glycosyl hydrolase, partial [Bacteroidota bacterium]